MGTAEVARAGGIFQRLSGFIARWPLVVIGFWIALAAVVTLELPPLTQIAARDQTSLLPDDAPVMVITRQMGQAFQEKGRGALLVIVLTDEDGLGPADEATYGTLVGELRADTQDNMSIQEFISTPALREVLASKDNKAWTVPINFPGEVGGLDTQAGYKRVAEIVNKTVAGSALTAHLAGPVANVADLTALSERDLPVLEIGTSLLVLAILVLIYRNLITVLVPLITIGVSVVVAQRVLSGLGELGLAVNMQTIVLMSAVMIGAGTDYTVFLISRYHDYMRLGECSDRAVKKALLSIGKVLAASAATVAVTFLAMVYSRLTVFSQVGPAISISIVVVFLAAVTLLPAILIVAGRLGWIKPRRNQTTRFWRRSGMRVVRRPWLHLILSLIVLIVFCSCASLARFNYDDIKSLAGSVDSARGYDTMNSHFPLNSMTPEALFIESPRDLRSPEALADLEQMAQRVSQLPGITMVRGLTRPNGEPLMQTRLSYQAGEVGGKIDEASSEIQNHGSDMDKLGGGANKLAEVLAEAQGKVSESVDGLGTIVTELADIPGMKGPAQAGEDDIEVLVERTREFDTTLTKILEGIKHTVAWADPVLMALSTSRICSANANCASWRDELQALITARNNGTFDQIAEQTRSLRATLGLQDLDLSAPGTVRTRIAQLQQGVSKLAESSQLLAEGVRLLIEHTKQLGSGLSDASAFLLAMKRDAEKPSMAGFNLPPQVLTAEEFKKAAQIFISPDGHAARYLVQSALNPFTPAAMDQVNTITAAAQSAQPNTELADARISLTGVPTGLRDTRDYFNHDIEFIIVATIIIVFLILVALLRAIVAPLYLMGSVLISYLSALGIGVIAFQLILGQEMHWSVPGLTFILLVALGADYNMLLISRIRDESPNGVRFGVVRTVESTGPAITSAGLIFAASMFGLLSASLPALVQAGFVIGVGIVIDTFLVRTITVPALAVLIGQANWWPARPRPRTVQQANAQKPVPVPAGSAEHGIGATPITAPSPTLTAPSPTLTAPSPTLPTPSPTPGAPPRDPTVSRGRHRWPSTSPGGRHERQSATPRGRHQQQNATLPAQAARERNGTGRSAPVTGSAENRYASTQSMPDAGDPVTVPKRLREMASTQTAVWTTYLRRPIGSSSISHFELKHTHEGNNN
jgi:putative drug exporter of the RND superfamily